MTTSADRTDTDVAAIEQHNDGIDIHWDSQTSDFYHYFWLRSACFCELCGDSLTGSRRLQPDHVEADIKPTTVVLASESCLQIKWQPDGHVSEYDLNWLKEYRYGNEKKPLTWQPNLWDASLDINQISHSLVEVESDDLAYLNLLRDLRDFGIAIVKGGAMQPGIEHMAGLIGDMADAAYTKVFELKPNSQAHTYGNTTMPIPPHTDEAYLHTPTGILVLYCINPASDGGESILVDGFNLATQLAEKNPAAFDVLATCPQSYHRIVPGEGMDFRTRARALNINEQGQLVGFRFHPRSMAPIDTPTNITRELHSANHALSELMMRQSNQLCFRLAAGDAVFFDNHRVMHSRKSFSVMNRHLQICNLSRDQFHQKVRLSAKALGFSDEARQYLPAGVSG
jgi:alpha-ketoglutarate-dependent taurine dioxygenase